MNVPTDTKCPTVSLVRSSLIFHSISINQVTRNRILPFIRHISSLFFHSLIRRFSFSSFFHFLFLSLRFLSLFLSFFHFIFLLFFSPFLRLSVIAGSHLIFFPSLFHFQSSQRVPPRFQALHCRPFNTTLVTISSSPIPYGELSSLFNPRLSHPILSPFTHNPLPFSSIYHG